MSDGVMNPRIRVQAEDIDLDREIEALSGKSGAVGAIATFLGLVRGDDGLRAMTLEHYPGMTEREIARYVEEAGARWPLDGVTIIHRVGRLVPGERIVLVAVASRHRESAFEACRFLMDYLKTRAPFWKLEERGNGNNWVEAKASDSEAATRWKRE